MYDVKTCGNAGQEDTLSFNYAPSPYLHIMQLIENYHLGRGDHLVDFGCGKGRVVLVAASYPCDMISGVDINAELCELLTQNLKTSKIEKRCGNIEINNIDARRFSITEDMNKFYFFEPFHLKILIYILNNIMQSLQKCSRKIELYFYLLHPSWEKYLTTHPSVHKKGVLYDGNQITYTISTNTY